MKHVCNLSPFLSSRSYNFVDLELIALACDGESSDLLSNFIAAARTSSRNGDSAEARNSNHTGCIASDSSNEGRLRDGRDDAAGQDHG